MKGKKTMKTENKKGITKDDYVYQIKAKEWEDFIFALPDDVLERMSWRETFTKEFGKNKDGKFIVPISDLKYNS